MMHNELFVFENLFYSSSFFFSLSEYLISSLFILFSMIGGFTAQLSSAIFEFQFFSLYSFVEFSFPPLLSSLYYSCFISPRPYAFSPSFCFQSFFFQCSSYYFSLLLFPFFVFNFLLLLLHFFISLSFPIIINLLHLFINHSLFFSSFKFFSFSFFFSISSLTPYFSSVITLLCPRPHSFYPPTFTITTLSFSSPPTSYSFLFPIPPLILIFLLLLYLPLLNLLFVSSTFL